MASDKRIILITGANSGIGFDTAYALAANSPKNHVLVAARTESKGEKAVKDIQARNPSGTVSFIQLDVTSDESIAAAAKKIETEYGRLDILINNAGIGVKDKPTRIASREVFETNVIGPQVLTEVVAPLLEKSDEPRIVNVSSGLGSIKLRLDPSSGYHHIPADDYRMSKAALNMLTVCWKYHFRDWKNTPKIFTFCPGYVVTNIEGEENKEIRKAQGAESSETSAQGILEIVNGDRDAEADLFLARYGQTYPW